MTESTTSAGQLKFKAPTSDEWCALPVDGEDKDQQQKTKNARDTLKETLLTSLQMQHIVVLAGSGTSLEVGGPSMRDLWDAAIGNPPNQDSTSIAKKINYDLNALPPNLEEFLSKSEAYLQVTDDTDVKMFVNSCKKVILEMCSTFLNVEKLEAHKTFLHRLSRRRVRDPRLKVFTTNYDLCFEQAASALGGVVIDGFSFTPPRHYTTLGISATTSSGVPDQMKTRVTTLKVCSSSTNSTARSIGHAPPTVSFKKRQTHRLRKRA